MIKVSTLDEPKQQKKIDMPLQKCQAAKIFVSLASNEPKKHFVRHTIAELGTRCRVLITSSFYNFFVRNQKTSNTKRTFFLRASSSNVFFSQGWLNIFLK